jgi:hypothetical protein
MHIKARGWGRNQGETEILNVALESATDSPGPGNYYQLDQAYLDIENAYTRRSKVKIAAGTEHLRMGGRYLLRIELSRKEIAKLFFATHDGDIVRTFKSLLEDEEREEERREAAAFLARHQQFEAQKQRRELLEQLGEKFASLKQQKE